MAVQSRACAYPLNLSRSGFVHITAAMLFLVSAFLLAGQPATAQDGQGRPGNSAATQSVGPLTFETDEVELSVFMGTITVEPGDGAKTTVVVTGPADRVGEVTIEERGGAVSIRGAHQRNNWYDWDRWFDGSPATSELNDFAVISIILPQGGSFSADKVIGAIRVGDTEGPVALRGLSADAAVGSVSQASIAIAGQGKVRIDEVTGSFSLAIAGAGDAEVDRVSGDARVAIRGSGDVVLGTMDGGLDMEISGSGDAVAETVNGPVRVRINGSGDVAMGGGRADPLTVVIRGSGDLRFEGTAVNPDINVAGSGSVSLGAIEGTLRSRGNGDITVGRN